MELDKFIEEALSQILKGIQAANAQVIGHNVRKPFLLEHGGGNNPGTGIEFDVAVTVKSEGGGKGSVKAKVLSVFEAEIGGKGSLTRERVSHIRFKVFVNQWQG